MNYEPIKIGLATQSYLVLNIVFNDTLKHRFRAISDRQENEGFIYGYFPT